MPRWRALPEELDPQIREFASQLRRLVDRSGMSVATIADRTGYSKSSWERYLNGRLLPPRGATQALAEVTGTEVRHLGTMWELAERAWSRSEMRHDVTMEAIQVAQARAALGEFGDDQDKGRRRRKGKGGAGAGGAGAAAEGPVAPPSLPEQAGAARGGEAAVPSARNGAPTPASTSSASHAPSTETSGPETDDGTQVLRRTPAAPTGADEGTARLREGPLGAGAAAGAAGATGFAGTRERHAPERERRDGPPVAARSGQQRVDPATWGAPGSGEGAHGRAANGPGAWGQGAGPGGPGGPGAPVRPPVPQGRGASDVPGPVTAGTPGGGRGAAQQGAGRRRVTMFLAGIVGALVVVAAAVLFFDVGGGDDEAAPSPSPTKKSENLPAGVKCAGEDCSGKDPEAMGCGGQYAKTTSSAWVGPSFVEVRHSKVCKASWARITSAATDDALRITGPGGQAESDNVGTTNDAYTEMVSVRKPNDAKACATLAAGTKGCTTPGETAR